VTDAAAALGMLASGELAGGLRLRFDLARDALDSIGRTVGLETDELARGMLTIAGAAMAAEIRSVTIEQGRDPRTASLIAYGGAGPLFATLLARELEIGQIIVPRYAGNFSASSLLGQDLTRSRAVTARQALDAKGLANANEHLERLFAELGSNDSFGAEARREVALDLRYVGQEWTLTIAPPSQDGVIDADADTVAALFASRHQQTFGHALDHDVEMVTARATVRTALPRRAEAPAEGGQAGGAREVEAYSFTEERHIPFQVIHRDSLATGSTHSGPVIVVEDTTTTYIDSGFDLEIGASRIMMIRTTGRS
jgi:N-methylhydantoinase A